MMRVCLVVVCILWITSARAQQDSLTRKDAGDAIDSIASILQRYYVFPDKAAKISAYLQQQKNKGAYNGFSTYTAFASQVNKDIQQVHQDLHLKLSYDPEKAALVRKADNAKPDSSIYKKRAAREQYFNYGIFNVQRLAGNIAYIDLREFVNLTTDSKKAIDAAFSTVGQPSAFIIDLRENGGGSIDMSRYISSYFFADSVHLTDVVNRISGVTEHFWTTPHAVAKKFSNTPLYILTSGATFSAAEEFAYSMQQQKRATIIGEKSAGGAHGFGSKAVGSYLVLGIPFERIENAITKDNWEGKGVVPDIPISSVRSLLKAQLEILQKLNLPDDADARQEVKWRKDYLAAVLQPLKLSQELLQGYVGTYGSRQIILEGETLFLVRKDGSKFKMIPVDDHTFFINEVNYRIQFEKTSEQKFSLYLVFEDGYRQEG